ncbi:MAG: hypothetical protein LBP43_04880, partial [Treponema sp.]|nr:hypothetical protein [Treponema sp.]
MITETKPEDGTGLTFEKVWAMFQETARKFQETDRQFKETALRMKETDRKISKLGNRVGELVEHLVSPNIVEKFNQLGYDFGKISPNVRFKGHNDALAMEVDILLENGDVVLAVEVKTKLTADDVSDHIERMKKLRRYAEEHQDRRKLLGAVAGAIVPEGVKPFAIKNGFYVIEQAGDTVKIDIPEGFSPK